MFKRLFFSKGTVIAAFVGILLTGIGITITGCLANETGWFDYFDILARIILSVFLFCSYMSHNILAMQAASCGILVCAAYYQAGYVFTELFSQSMDSFIALGFWGSFYLAGELMLLILESIAVINHFAIFILKRGSFLRISVNQMLLVIMLAFLLFQLFVISRMAIGPMQFTYYILNTFYILALYLLIACTQLILTLDMPEVASK